MTVALSVADRPGPPNDGRSLADLRSDYARVVIESQPFVPVTQVLEDSLAGRGGTIKVRRYLPGFRKSSSQPALLFFHGGDWVAGGLHSHDRLCRRVAMLTGQQLVAVDYRLAPENRFPAAVEDAIDSHMLLLSRADAWGIDPVNVSLMGDGAGATLASVVALHARDMCHPMPTAQILFYPVTDMTNPAAVTRKLAQARYLRDDTDALDWRASPGLATTFVGLPPTFIAIPRNDPLHDCQQHYADRLADARVTVETWHAAGVPHGFLTRTDGSLAASRSLAAAVAFLASLAAA